LWFSLVTYGKCWDNTSKISHYLFLPHPSQFIIEDHPVIEQYISAAVDRVPLNKPRNKQNTEHK
jgi:hypothetical protein